MVIWVIWENITRSDIIREEDRGKMQNGATNTTDEAGEGLIAGFLGLYYHLSQQFSSVGFICSNTGEILNLASQHVVWGRGGIFTGVMCSAFTRYSVYWVGTRRLCFPAFQHRGQRHLQISAPRTASGHSALTGAEAAPNCCFPPTSTKLPSPPPVKTPPPLHVCAWKSTAVISAMDARMEEHGDD